MPKGSTIIPLIFATDKTEISHFSGDHSAYPLYMTIGNIDKATRRMPSQYAWILVGYLPTDALTSLDLTDPAISLSRSRLFHMCMRQIVEPLIDAGSHGILLAGGDGAVRRCHPILAIYIADYPEQCVVTCSRYMQVCPVCGIPKDKFGLHKCHGPRKPPDVLRTLRKAAAEQTIKARDAILKSAGLNFIVEPFWKDLPHCNIFKAITPDILHQGYQGVLTHLIHWLRTIMSDNELDARFQRLPPMHGLRTFKNGISRLSRVSGAEHKQICRQLLGCIIGKAPPSAVRATVALLNFFYLAQYESHSDETLGYLRDVLRDFHNNKAVFIETGARGKLSYSISGITRLMTWQILISIFPSFTSLNTTATSFVSSAQPMDITLRLLRGYILTTSRRPSVLPISRTSCLR